MHNFIELAKEEVPQLENALKKIDVFLNRAPEGCLKWQNKCCSSNYLQLHVALYLQPFPRLSQMPHHIIQARLCT